MTGIYDCFGYGSGYDVSFEERYKLIRKSGFDCVMLWWSNQFGRGDGYQEDVRLARRAGLFVENIHAPVHEQNNLSLDNLSGEGVFQSYLQCVADCFEYDIPTMVIHLPNDNNPLNQTGIRRLAELILLAKKIGFDPAVMASPFITTIVDALSLLIYFRFASFLLGI